LENILDDDAKKGIGKKILRKHKKIIKKIPKPEKDIWNSSNVLKEKLDFFPKSKPILNKPKNSSLFIPKPNLPQRFDYLKPTPTNLEIDLGRLNSLLKDPLIRNIECNGLNQNLVVEGKMGRKKTNIFLSKEEIDEVIRRFSEITKIPLHEGVFRVVAGRLIFSAIISSVIGSKFIIKKMMYSPQFRR